MAKGDFHAISDRVSTVRFRTWTTTIVLIVMLVFFYIMNVTTRASLSWIDFVLLCIVQVVAHSIYFPDGEIFGEKDKSFVANKEKYNSNADIIIDKKKHENLRVFCDYEYEERKQRYIITQCGYIGITYDEFKILKQLSKKEIRHLDTFETKEIVDGKEEKKLIQFGRKKKAMLYRLIFKPLPVEKNNPDTIMSAVENDGTKKIKDTSISFKRRNYVRKFLQATLLGALFAYVVYTVRDGFGLAEITSIIMCLGSMIVTAVLAFSSGETCSKVYKSRFYLELGNFIDEFLDWDIKNPAVVKKE